MADALAPDLVAEALVDEPPACVETCALVGPETLGFADTEAVVGLVALEAGLTLTKLGTLT